MSSPILADTNTEEKDPIEEMLDRTGCKKTHISLQVFYLCEMFEITQKIITSFFHSKHF